MAQKVQESELESLAGTAVSKAVSGVWEGAGREGAVAALLRGGGDPALVEGRHSAGD